MRLNKYLKEATDKNIEITRKIIAKRIKVDPKYLKFIGMADYKDMGKGYNFNVTDKKHKQYKSTTQELVK